MNMRWPWEGSPAQKKQRILSWKLRMVMVARGTLYPREKEIQGGTKYMLLEIDKLLGLTEAQLRKDLKELK